MMSSPGNAFVRASYLASVVFGPMLVALPAGFLLVSQLAQERKDWASMLAIVMFALLFVLPGWRAIRRLIAQGTVIPRQLVSERPVVSFVVTLFGGFGHFWFLITMSAAIGIALAPEWPEEAKKIVGPLALGLMCYFIALWCGEWALVGNGVSDKMKMGSDPIC